MIVLPQPAEAAALTGRHSAGDEIGSTRGFSRIARPKARNPKLMARPVAVSA
jgi:hypothetical protein